MPDDEVDAGTAEQVGFGVAVGVGVGVTGTGCGALLPPPPPHPVIVPTRAKANRETRGRNLMKDRFREKSAAAEVRASRISVRLPGNVSP